MLVPPLLCSQLLHPWVVMMSAMLVPPSTFHDPISTRIPSHDNDVNTSLCSARLCKHPCVCVSCLLCCLCISCIAPGATIAPTHSMDNVGSGVAMSSALLQDGSQSSLAQTNTSGSLDAAGKKMASVLGRFMQE